MAILVMPQLDSFIIKCITILLKMLHLNQVIRKGKAQSPLPFADRIKCM